jgi:hypothetical protein
LVVLASAKHTRNKELGEDNLTEKGRPWLSLVVPVMGGGQTIFPSCSCQRVGFVFRAKYFSSSLDKPPNVAYN